ncbi:Gfo/Idh/MocA family oxidoreductase [Litorilinea aerophila]|uniref:Gfo/Idh/MocA family protein n=1 Tax=Litorilinea aerophila TaxID=1204385 RepID=UPI001B866F61|nr:Gfo/Idh/MocA family oxidoreductase [Litorilinea aerophila]MCC9074563.1 Gfo/Idh/MocA family oxidoreductase [Litorilinea aerophila]
MALFRVGIIGCGRPWRSEGATGFGMSHAHALGYKASPDAEIVALADINLENARAFQEQHGGERIYTDYREMLEKEALDIVSISTWPHLHAEMVIAAAEAGVKAIHCEKPMAPTYGESRRMVEVCERHGVQLTFNHQRRFGEPYRKAKELLKSGAIGTLERMEATCPNLFDWGTHWFDMLFFYNDETPVEWVIGQVDTRDSREIFGVKVEGQGLSYFKAQNGVFGQLITGHDTNGLTNRLVGSEGLIEVGHSQEVPLRYFNPESRGWQPVPVSEGLHGQEFVQRGVLDLIDALKTGREPELSARRALRATELIFATYESSRRRGRVDLPLTIDDSPLQAMLAAQQA